MENKSSKHLWLTMTALGLFTFMSTLDASIVNIALPIMSRDLAVPMNQATWTVSIYLIVISGLLTFFGRLGDQVGKIHVFKWGTYIFTLGSLLAGFNFGLAFLLFARVIQALGASMTMSNSFGITTDVAPLAMRARAMSFNALFVSLGSIAGPALGGIILQYLPWSYIFWINVPVGILAIIAGNYFFPKNQRSKQTIKIDWLGAGLFFSFITVFFLGINLAQIIGFMAPLSLLLDAISVLLLGTFIIWERRVDKPLLDLTIFKTGLFTLSLIASLLVFTTNFFSNVLLPFYLENLRGFSTGKSGLFMMTVPVAMMIGAPLAGMIADKYDREYVTLFALSGLVLAMFGWRVIDGNSAMGFVVLLMALAGLGTAFFQTPNNALIMTAAPSNQLGVAGALNALARNLGMIIGTSAVTTALYFSMSNSLGKKVVAYPQGHDAVFVKGMQSAFTLGAILVLIAWSITFVRLIMRIRTKKSKNNLVR